MLSGLFVLLYFLITAGIGVYMMKKNSNVSEYFVAKKGLNWALIMPLMFAEMIAGAGTVGNAAAAFGYGISSVWMNWGMSIGVILVLFTVTKFFRSVGNKLNVMSVPGGFTSRFDKKTGLLMMAILCVVYTMLYASQPIAAAAIISPMIGADYTLICWVMAIIFIFLTITGGMKGMAWMNVVHSLVMYIGLGVVAVVAVRYVGGISGMQAALPASFFHLDQPSAFNALGHCLGTALSFVCASVVIATIFGATDMKEVNKGFWGACIAVLIFALFPALIGLAAKVAMPDAVANGVLYTMANQIGPVFGVFAAMGVLAAILSTGPAMLLLVTTMVSRDFYLELKPNATDQQQMNFSRIVTVVIGIVGVFVGLNASSILGQLLGAFQIRAIAGLILLLAVFWPRIDSRAAFWSMLVGGVIAAGWHFAGNPFGITSLWPSLAAGVPVLLILTFMAKEPVAEGYKKYQQALQETRAEEGW